MQIKDVYPEPNQDFPVRLNYEYAHRLIGKEIGAETIKNIATSLEMKIVKEDAEGLDLLVPAFRVDVQRLATWWRTSCVSTDTTTWRFLPS